MTRFLTEYKSEQMPIAEAIKMACAPEGWKFLEVVGTFREDGIPAANFSALTASSITAAALTNGVEIKRNYEQKASLYLTVTMQCPTGPNGKDGDRFILVFHKPKP